jgi:hypothetical protein
MCRQNVMAAQASSWQCAQQHSQGGRQQCWNWCSCCWRLAQTPCRGEGVTDGVTPCEPGGTGGYCRWALQILCL